MNTIKYLIGALLLCGAFVAPGSFAGNDIDLQLAFAGSGYDLPNSDPDVTVMNFFVTDAKGTFGKSSITILSKFAFNPAPSFGCPAGFDLPFDLVGLATTMTTAHVDQLYGGLVDGWLCMTPDNMQWIGGVNGDWIGGTGRFEQASGTWVGDLCGIQFRSRHRLQEHHRYDRRNSHPAVIPARNHASSRPGIRYRNSGPFLS